MAVSIDDLRQWLKLLPDSEENLEGLLAAAKSEARAAGIPDYKHNAQYDHYIRELVASYLEAKALSSPGAYQSSSELENMQRLKNSYTLSLRYAGEDPEPDDGGDA